MTSNGAKTPPPPSYGATNASAFEFEMMGDDYEANDAAPFLTPANKRWSVLEKLNRNHCCQIRSCHEFRRMFTCKCVFSTFMLIAFASMLALLIEVILFNGPFLSPSYDFIIVGAGSTGCILARALTDAGARVLLLEAGAATQSELGGQSWYGSQLTNFDIPLLWPVGAQLSRYSWKSMQNLVLGKGLGGADVFSSMVYLRATMEDITAWNLSDWSWSRMLDSYRSLEAADISPSQQRRFPYRGFSGPIRTSRVPYEDQLAPNFLRAANRLGYPLLDDLNDPTQPRQGAGYYQFMTKDGLRVSTATAMLAPVLQNPSLTTQLEATVRRLLINTFDASKLLRDRSNNALAAYGVEYVHNGMLKRAQLAYRRGAGQKRDFEGRRCIILAAGAVMTPKVLMSSGVGDPAELHAASLPVLVENAAVGKRLRDQVVVTALYAPTAPLAASYTSMYELAEQWGGYLTAVEDSLTGTAQASRSKARVGVLNSPGFTAGLFLASPWAASPSTPDIQITAYPSKSLTAEERSHLGHTDTSFHSAIAISVVLVQPNTTRTVRLHPSHPLDTMPLIIPADGSLGEQDTARMVWALQQVRKIMRTSPLDGLVGEEIAPGKDYQDDDQLGQWVQQEAQCVGRWVGSAAMGEDPDTSAVDPFLRVRGLNGVRVVDASVLPSLLSGDVQATVHAVANIAADMILES